MQKQLSVKIEGSSAVEIKKTERLIEIVSKLPAGDKNRLLQIAENKEALKGLEENFEVLKGFVGML